MADVKIKKIRGWNNTMFKIILYKDRNLFFCKADFNSLSNGLTQNWWSRGSTWEDNGKILTWTDAERLIFLTTIIFNLGESWCNVIVFSILCTHELISTESERNPLTRISLINGSIRARKHVHVAVNSACAEIRLACGQVLHLGESREFPRGPHAKRDARVRGGETVSHFSFWANSRTVQNGKRNECGQI